jgi:hypothetical protein
MALGDLIPSFGGGGLVGLAVQMFLGVMVLGLITLSIFMWSKNKKKWFITCVVLIPRSDGRIINSEIAKATYDAKRGSVFIKRKRKKPVPLKPFDVKRYLLGNDFLSVIQVGIEDYRPVLPESFLDMVDDSTGEEAALMNIKIDTSEQKAWKESFEREAKLAYSLNSILQQYVQYIGFGILFFMIFIGFAILYGRIT